MLIPALFQAQPQLQVFSLNNAKHIATTAFLCSSGITLLLSTTVIYPILELRRGLRQLNQALSQGEPLPYFLPHPSLPSDELSDIAAAVEQLYGQMTGVVQERRLAEQALRSANEQLERQGGESAQIEQRNQVLLQALGRLEIDQEQRIESERQAALGQLVAGIAHELNTPLGAMQASAGNLLNDLHALPEVLPRLWSDLSPEERPWLLELLERASTPRASLSARDRRQQRKSLERKLFLDGVRETREVADICIDLGIQTQYEAYLPLLAKTEGNWCRLFVQQVFQLYENSRTIRTAVGRASKIVFALKSYAQGHLQEPRAEIDLTHSIQSALSLCPSQLWPGVKLTRNYGNLPLIQGYPNALIQVWANLLHNALQAVEGAGEITIAAQTDGASVVVRIEDSGPGIPGAIQERIFEPFFTTRSPGEGSGLGLGLCRQVVAQHGGDLSVTSQPGQTVFVVRLPLSLSQDDA